MSKKVPIPDTARQSMSTRVCGLKISFKASRRSINHIFTIKLLSTFFRMQKYGRLIELFDIGQNTQTNPSGSLLLRFCLLFAPWSGIRYWILLGSFLQPAIKPLVSVLKCTQEKAQRGALSKAITLMHIIESISPSARSRGVILALNRLMSGHNSRSQEKGDKERSKHLSWRLCLHPGLCCSFVYPHADSRRILFINVFVIGVVFHLRITQQRIRLQHFLSLRVMTQS